MKMSEIRELSTQDLLERLDSERLMLTRMKLNHAISPIDNPQKIKQTRKNIARILTELRARELNKKTK
ncbi:MAG TPA: 50S ribosomal protein L29 [Bacteroidales bacterium]|nr:50S ribosomal protein L29 [Bacteroidales bacterium]HOK73753.1 50S ribosomal protein L29 [Bacteroidales bacterium]HOM39404.1 50S ribosomal protein L29 [Bacteroidales bacterium]HPP91513.1 50S ribosomal protein L29 [Bacteroidales bacterium]HQK69768.1 50S ribosomal protein L29 [Bacteroidales bacterium]